MRGGARPSTPCSRAKPCGWRCACAFPSASAISSSACARCSTATATSPARCPRLSTSPSAAAARKRCGNRKRWRRSASSPAASRTTSTICSPSSARPPISCARRDLREERRRRYVDAISDTVERASKLTAQLLAFARRQPLKPQIFNVGSQVEGVAQLVRPLVGGRIEIAVEVHDGDCFTVADIAQFETALINLAINARDAMDGEGRLTIAVRKVQGIPNLRAQSARGGDYVAISVADTGSGIAPENIEAIFEPFFTTKEVGKGTGLGLSQAFGFAKQSEGDIAVTSTHGEGATFTIYLPRAQSPATAQEAAALTYEAAATGRGYRVLVVEDDDEVGRFSTELLEDLGYVVRRVANANAALAILGENEFAVDLVFSDVIMPGMNGVELAGIIRERYPGLPVVLRSGYSNVLAENAHRGFELIQKPYSVELLSRILRKAITAKPSVTR